MNDHHFLTRAIDLAKKAQGHVEPNPMVGAIIVKNNEIIGEGYHQKFGEAHAEVNAIAACGTTTDRSTIYVTLEPCCHRGKTPPCVDAIIQAKFARVVIGAVDPNPKVAGQGIQRLREHGIQVDVGVCENECKRLIAPFAKLITTGVPWIIAKWAMTLDGKIATRNLDSKWISNARSRKIAHEIRARVDGILVGSQTVVADNPMLNARDVDLARLATRIVVDSQLRIPIDSRLVTTANDHPVIIATSSDSDLDKRRKLESAGCEIWQSDESDRSNRLSCLLEELGRRGMNNILVEGGAGLLGALNDLGQINEVHCFIAPKIIGGQNAITPIGGIGVELIDASWNLDHQQIQMIDSDIHVSGIVTGNNDVNDQKGKHS